MQPFVTQRDKQLGRICSPKLSASIIIVIAESGEIRMRTMSEARRVIISNRGVRVALL